MIEVGLVGALQPVAIIMPPSKELEFSENARMGEDRVVELSGEDSFGNQLYVQFNLKDCVYIISRTEKKVADDKTEYQEALDLLNRSKR